MKRKLLARVWDHPLVLLLRTLQGNPKVLVLIEPLWGIPYFLIAPFATIYMYTLGVTDVEIGLILSICTAVQIFFTFGSGILSDKLGRKLTTNLGDVLGWVVACLIWAFAQNFWFFLAAALINSFEAVNQTAWSCLLVEDTKQEKILGIYTWITIGGLLTVFFSPISGALIAHFSLVPVVRVLYVIFSISMLIKTIITVRYTTETQQGRIRKEQTKNTSYLALLREYKSVLPRLFRRRETIQTLVVMVALFITGSVTGSFFALYVSDSLGVPQHYLAIFPIFRAGVMLLFMFLVQHRLERLPFKSPMTVGLCIYIGNQLLLILIPAASVLPIILYTMLEACAFALVVPRKDSMLVKYVDPDERARIVALMTGFMLVFATPFGYIAGLLSSVDRRLPFALNIVMFVVALVVVRSLREEDASQTVGME